MICHRMMNERIVDLVSLQSENLLKIFRNTLIITDNYQGLNALIKSSNDACFC